MRFPAPGIADRYTFKSRMHSVSNRSPSVCVSRIRVFGAAPKTAAGNEGSTKYRLGLVRTTLCAEWRLPTLQIRQKVQVLEHFQIALHRLRIRLTPLIAICHIRSQRRIFWCLRDVHGKSSHQSSCSFRILLHLRHADIQHTCDIFARDFQGEFIV